jgi:hypothetical protein
MHALSSDALVFPSFRRSSFIFHSVTSPHKKSALKLQGGFGCEGHLNGIPSCIRFIQFSHQISRILRGVLPSQ